MSTISPHPFLLSAPVILPTPSQAKIKSSYNNKITITQVPNLSGEHPKKTNSCSYAHPFSIIKFSSFISFIHIRSFFLTDSLLCDSNKHKGDRLLWLLKITQLFPIAYINHFKNGENIF